LFAIFLSQESAVHSNNWEDKIKDRGPQGISIFGLLVYVMTLLNFRERLHLEVKTKTKRLKLDQRERKAARKIADKLRKKEFAERLGDFRRHLDNPNS